ncbi:MAG: hypothetical protein MUC47_02695 [Candidatus Kapabacteria bacterium]|nr:hypothetical protein [Candidatus Kapabacteria bacterium]
MTEEFRRFRIKAELARKQTDLQLKELQNNNVQRATQLITGQDALKDRDKIRSLELQIEKLKSEQMTRDLQFKESYDNLVLENKALKSSGSEALLASQWRLRYETCLREKEELEAQLQSTQSTSKGDEKYEEKYRDLKGKHSMPTFVYAQSFVN